MLIPVDGCRGQRQNTIQWGNQGKCCEMVKKTIGTNKISCSQLKILRYSSTVELNINAVNMSMKLFNLYSLNSLKTNTECL